MARDRSPDTRPDTRPESRPASRHDTVGLSSGAATVMSAARARRTASGGDTGLGFGANHSTTTSLNPTALRRRSSNLSDYSQDARDLLNPGPLRRPGSSGKANHAHATSTWDSLPLAFALLPAVGGLLVQGGSSFVTDLMLLCLGALFLHWSVTQPWAWYHVAQQVREDHEAAVSDVAVHSDSDDDRGRETPLADVQEEEEGDQAGSVGPVGAREARDDKTAAQPGRQRDRDRLRARQESALRELYRHEVAALLSCFVLPLLGAWLLHALRGQLTRPSEGLISNFNLTVFLMGAEVRPLRHILQLVQARTLHLQRVVHANPYREEEERYRARRAQEEQQQNHALAGLVARLEQLEALQVQPAASSSSVHAARETLGRSESYESYFPDMPPTTRSPVADKDKKDADTNTKDTRRDREQLVRDVRAQIQPDLDAMARALRRAHKQQTLLEDQVAGKLSAVVGTSVQPPVAVAPAAPNAPNYGALYLFCIGVWVSLLWLLESAVAVVMYIPRKLVLALATTASTVATFPSWIVCAVVGRPDPVPARTTDDGPSIVGGTLRPRKKRASRVAPDVDKDYTLSWRHAV